ncbi:MAG: glutaredoxin domain-containing protein [Candidatus Paceibacterota bacterium]
MEKNNKIEIYSTPECHYCKEAKKYFTDKKIEYKEYNVVTDKEKRQDLTDKYKVQGVPLILIDGKPIYGWNKEKVEEELAK